MERKLTCGRIFKGIITKSPRRISPAGAQFKSRQRPTFPRSCPRSIIGAERLNDRVRDGNGCVPLAMATGKRIIFFIPELGHVRHCLRPFPFFPVERQRRLTFYPPSAYLKRLALFC